MATITSHPQFTPQHVAMQHFQEINDLGLREPAKSAALYAKLVATNPERDRAVCQQAGKVLHIIARLSQMVTDQVTVRGTPCPLNWEVNHNEDPPAENQNFCEKHFTLFVDRHFMNEMLEFKFCALPENVTDKLRWSTGENYSVDLRRHGHVTVLEIDNVTFS